MYHIGSNHIIRYDEITGSAAHSFNDGIGGGVNFSDAGFRVLTVTSIVI